MFLIRQTKVLNVNSVKSALRLRKCLTGTVPNPKRRPKSHLARTNSFTSTSPLILSETVRFLHAAIQRSVMSPDTYCHFSTEDASVYPRGFYPLACEVGPGTLWANASPPLKPAGQASPTAGPAFTARAPNPQKLPRLFMYITKTCTWDTRHKMTTTYITWITCTVDRHHVWSQNSCLQPF